MNREPLIRESDIVDKLAQCQVEPSRRFYQLMENQPWMSAPQPAHVGSQWHDLLDRIRTPLFGAIAILLLFGVVITTPSLRLLAQQILHLFAPAPTDTVATTEIMQDISDYKRWNTTQRQSMTEVAQVAGFDVGFLDFLPEGYHFGQMTYLPKEQLIVSEYVYSTLPFTDAMMIGVPQLLLAQQPLAQGENMPLFFRIGASAEIEVVSFTHLQGEYVQGGWTANSSEDPTLKWRLLSCCRLLRWQESGFIFTLSTHSEPATPGFVGRDALIKIAANLTLPEQHKAK